MRVATALDEELGGHGRWERLIVDAPAQMHREQSKRLARAALAALQDFEWPNLKLRTETPDGPMGIVLSGRTVQKVVRTTISAALSSDDR